MICFELRSSYMTLFNVEINRNVDTLFHFQPSFIRREDSEDLFSNNLLLLEGERAYNEFLLRCIQFSQQN